MNPLPISDSIFSSLCLILVSYPYISKNIKDENQFEMSEKRGSKQEKNETQMKDSSLCENRRGLFLF